LTPSGSVLYYAGCRKGAAKKMTWSTVSKDCSEIELPGEIVKNDDPLALPLAGPLEEIGNLLKKMRKTFPKPNDPIFNFKNFRWTWDKTCCQLGLGTFDEKTKKHSGLVPHDFRRSGSQSHQSRSRSSHGDEDYRTQNRSDLRAIQH